MGSLGGAAGPARRTAGSSMRCLPVHRGCLALRFSGRQHVCQCLTAASALAAEAGGPSGQALSPLSQRGRVGSSFSLTGSLG